MSAPRLKLRKYAVAAIAAVQERLAYRGSFLGEGLTYALWVFVFSRIWRAAYAGRAELAGYGLSQMVWYFIAAELPSFAPGRPFWSLSDDMKSGQVAYLVSRPYDFVAYNFSQGAGQALASGLAYLAEGILLGLAFAGPLPVSSVLQAAAALASLALAASIQYLLQLAIAMTAFWAEENSAFYWIFSKLALVLGTLMPLEMLSETAQRVTWWTPFPALAYVPARILAAWPGAPAAARLLGFQLAWLALSFLACEAIYAAARSRFAVNGG